MAQDLDIVQAPRSEASQDEALPQRASIPAFLPHTQVRPTMHTSGYWRLTTSTLTVRYLIEGFRDVFRDVFSLPVMEKRISRLSETMLSGAEQDKKLLTQGYFPKLKKELTSEMAEDRVRQVEYARAYDMGLGAFCGTLTLTHTYNTFQTIKNMYAETVAMELGKPADQVGFGDLQRSKNAIVQNAMHNAESLNSLRLAADSIFFGRALSGLEKHFEPLAKARSVNFGYLGLGAKALLLMKDITSRQATMFETLTDFSERKINPVHGIAESITISDMVDIYQKYAEFARPNAMFKDITIRQQQDAKLDWPKSEKVFTHLAELMNQSYKYKKSNLSDAERHMQSEQITVNFTLPKYVYMLGNGMIDPYHPDETLTLIEVAARQNVKALDAAAAMIRGGVPALEVAQRFGVEKTVPTFAQNAQPAAKVHGMQSAGQVVAPASSLVRH